MSLSQHRAANLARMEAERLNGGLSKYVTANCMYQKGGGNCMVNAGPNGSCSIALVALRAGWSTASLLSPKHASLSRQMALRPSAWNTTVRLDI